MAKSDDASDADRAKHAKEELDQATRELDALDPDAQARVLELLTLDKPSLELLLEQLQKLKDGKIQPAEYRKLVASLQVQSLSEKAAKRAPEKGKAE